ncbi:hypothetical protein [Terasakiella pusilla]|jgi:hypothetical protein|uniref:hypothetical protein n=1 Tax=Terasakiella pusilla TaxID=64973 RepID=UPI003AA956DD
MLRLLTTSFVIATMTLATAALADGEKSSQSDDHTNNSYVQDKMEKNDAGKPDMTLEEAFKNATEDAKTIPEKAKDAYNAAKKKVTE